MGAQTLTVEDLRWVVCPFCHQRLELEAGAIRCQGCRRRYPIVDGIPVLLADRATSSWPAWNFLHRTFVESLVNVSDGASNAFGLSIWDLGPFFASNIW